MTHYRAFTRVVGKQYICSKKDLPDDPALAVYLLQQAAEKTVKAIAIASGQFEDEKLKQDYSHNSLMLLSDVLLKYFVFPFVVPVSDILRTRRAEFHGISRG